MLRTILEQAFDDPAAHAVLVTAEAGIGKSRMRDEFVREIGQRDVGVFFSRGDPMRAGSPFGILAQLVRSATAVADRQPLEQRRDKLRARVTRHAPPGDVARVLAFLGELVGTPFVDERSAEQLRAARGNAVLTGDQVRRAWEDWLAGECAARPCVLVLE